MARKKRREYDDDDGRTIADMNVDGMPWYIGDRTPFPEEEGERSKRTPLSRAETRRYIWAALKAGLLIAAVYGVVYGLFLLFCQFVWLR